MVNVDLPDPTKVSLLLSLLLLLFIRVRAGYVADDYGVDDDDNDDGCWSMLTYPTQLRSYLCDLRY